MKRSYWYVLAVLVLMVILFASCSAQAARCDGNNGNGKGNVCEPASPPSSASPHTVDSNRKYIERVHSYAHGNSLGIQALRRTTNAIEAVNVAQETRIANKVDKSTFEADQARQDKALASKVDRDEFAKDQARQDKTVHRVATQTKQLTARANQTDIDVKAVQSVNARQDATLASHGTRLDGHDAQFANMTAVNAALDTRLNGAYQRLDQHSAQLERLERKSERADEANAIALAVAGHQFDTKGGFQTAVSASTVNGKQALAIGMGGAINERVFVNAGIASSGSTTGGVVSSTYSW